MERFPYPATSIPPRGTAVLCLAHVTNTMAQTGADFEKGEADGTRDALAVLGKIIADLLR